jgi:phosphinothricin acetyltransferase
LIALRDAAPADAPAVAALYAHHVLHGFGTFEEVPPPPEELALRMAGVEGRGLPWLLAEAEGALLGYAYATPYRDRSGYRFSVEDSVYVAPAAQGRGAGRALLDGLIERCTRLGFRQMIASIGDSGNAPSVRLHEVCGFEHRGRLLGVGFKHGRWLDVVWMQRPLG